MHIPLLLIAFAEGTPVPQPRKLADPRFPGRTIMPSNADEWKRDVRAAVKLEMMYFCPEPYLPRGTPVRVDIDFWMPRPKAHYRTGRYSGMLKPNAPTWVTNTPDRDNLDKAVLDSIGVFGGLLVPLLWDDDSQAVDGRIRKRYVRPGKPAGALITIQELA